MIETNRDEKDRNRLKQTLFSFIVIHIDIIICAYDRNNKNTFISGRKKAGKPVNRILPIKKVVEKYQDGCYNIKKQTVTFMHRRRLK